jgi:arylsulfatase
MTWVTEPLRTVFQVYHPKLTDADRVFSLPIIIPHAVSSASGRIVNRLLPNRIGFSGALDHRSRYGISEDEETIAEVLKKKGYATSVFGKWHLGCQEQFLPLNHGFDEFYGIPYSHDMWPGHPTGQDYYPPLPLYEGNDVIETNPDYAQFTSAFTSRAIEFIRSNRNRPFLHLSCSSPATCAAGCL